MVKASRRNEIPLRVRAKIFYYIWFWVFGEYQNARDYHSKGEIEKTIKKCKKVVHMCL